jgi:hypothetical protein
MFDYFQQFSTIYDCFWPLFLYFWLFFNYFRQLLTILYNFLQFSLLVTWKCYVPDSLNRIFIPPKQRLQRSMTLWIVSWWEKGLKDKRWYIMNRACKLINFTAHRAKSSYFPLRCQTFPPFVYKSRTWSENFSIRVLTHLASDSVRKILTLLLLICNILLLNAKRKSWRAFYLSRTIDSLILFSARIGTHQIPTERSFTFCCIRVHYVVYFSRRSFSLWLNPSHSL